MDLRKSIAEYLDFINKISFQYKTDEVLELITDSDELMNYCQKNNKRIGIVNRTEFNIHLIDLVKNSNGELFLYERIVKAVQGNSVVIMPFHNDKIILLKQFRHALGDYQYALPRGFGEINLSPEENARKEIREELGCESESYVFLGNVVADSGLCGEKVCVFKCCVNNLNIREQYENIVSYVEATEQEFAEMVKNGMINDGFTLSAFTLHNLKK